MLRDYNAWDASRYQGITADSILYNPPIFESILRHVTLKTIRNLSELNAYFGREVNLYIREVANPKLARKIFQLVCPDISETNEELTDLLDSGPDLDLDDTLGTRFSRFCDGGLKLKFATYIHRCFIKVITMVRDLSDLRIINTVKGEGNYFGVVMRNTMREIDDLLDPTRTSVLDAIANIDDRVVWIRLFGQRALVPFDEFFDKFVVTPLLPRSKIFAAKRYWRWLTDFPFTGFVTPYAFNDVIRRFGPVADLVANVDHLLTRQYYIGHRKEGSVASFMKANPRCYMAWDDRSETPTENGVKVTIGTISQETGVSVAITYETSVHTNPLRRVIAGLEAAGYMPKLTNFSTLHAPRMTFADYSHA